MFVGICVGCGRVLGDEDGRGWIVVGVCDGRLVGNALGAFWRLVGAWVGWTALVGWEVGGCNKTWVGTGVGC